MKASKNKQNQIESISKILTNFFLYNDPLVVRDSRTIALIALL